MDALIQWVQDGKVYQFEPHKATILFDREGKVDDWMLERTYNSHIILYHTKTEKYVLVTEDSQPAGLLSAEWRHRNVSLIPREIAVASLSVNRPWATEDGLKLLLSGIETI